MSRSLHLASLKVISLAGAAMAATRVVRQDPSQPTSTPVFIWNALDLVTACSPATIFWVYGGPNSLMSLTVSNVGVSQNPPPSSLPASVSRTFTDGDSPNARRAVPTGVFQVTQPIATVLPEDLSFNWTQVAVPQGWYQLYAAIPSSGFVTVSPEFFVQELEDITCLSLPSSSSTPTAPPSGSSTPSTTTPTPPSDSPSTPVLPVSGASSPVNKGAIAGGVVGGVALLVAVLGIYLCLVRSKRRSVQAHSPRSRRPPSLTPSKRGPQRTGGWGGLSSVDSHHDSATRKPKPKPKPYASARHHSQADSLGPIIPGGGVPSEEDVQPYRVGGAFSPSEEKFSLGEVGTLPYTQAGRPGALGRTYSASSIASTNEYVMGRRPSVNSTNALPPGARRPSNEYPPHAPSPSPQMDRIPSGASSQQPQQRKTPRKPVPVYSPSFPASPSSSTPSTTAPTTPLSTSPFDDQPVQRRVSGGHYATRNGSGDDVKANKDGKKEKDRRAKDKEGKDSGDDGLPVLNHKSSFGPGGVEGKPLHYLIPDMPPPPVA